MNTAPRDTHSTCPYCGVGCGVIIESVGNQITGVRGDPQHPANFGRLCSKGQTLHLTAAPQVTAQSRLLQPWHRPRRGGPLEPLGWEAAMDSAARRIAGIVREHGADAVGFHVSGQLLTEDYYVFNKLVKGLLGTNHIDSNSRLCMSSAVAAYKATLGADAPPACYDDIAHAGCVVIAGSNTAWAHPVLFRRLEDARRANPSQKWVVVDPQRTDTAAAADLHLQLLPGTDIALFHGLLHVMMWEGWVNHAFVAAHTSGFEALRERVREFTPALAAQVTGCRAEDIVQAARWFATAGPSLSLYCQGLNQSHHGTDSNIALINLHLATGQIGQPGAGPLSLTGQPNAMGGREVGAMATLGSAHRDLASPAHRAEMAAFWGLGDLPAAPGRTAVEMFEAAAEGSVKALWIACTNPAHSLPDQALVRRALERCEFVVLQEAFAHTATEAFADLLLPATPWGEKSGTVTNSERRISRVRAAVPAAGLARADWAIAQDLGQRLEALLPGHGRRGQGTLFGFRHPQQVWNEHRDSTRGTDLDITGLSYERLEAPQQWPCPDAREPGRARLYADGRFPTGDGRARFGAPAHRGVAEPRSARRPFSLLSGRLRDQWHGMSRSGQVARLFGQAGEPAVTLHPQDMRRLGLGPGQLVRLRSAQGELVLPATAGEQGRPAQAWLPMHWGSEWLAGAGINALFSRSRCARSQQPELKHAAVTLAPAALGWQLAAACRAPAGQALELRRHLLAWAQGLVGASAPQGFAAATLFGREPAATLGVRLHLALAEAPPATAILALQRMLPLDAESTLRYEDPRRGTLRCLALDGAEPTSPLRAFLLVGDVRARPWLAELIEGGGALPVGAARLLASGEQPPAGTQARSEQVCNCLDVGADAVQAALSTLSGDAHQRLAGLQARLGCGTQCGSCLPALRGWVAKVPAPVAAPAPLQNATV